MGRSGGRSQRAQSWPARSNFIARWQWPAGTGAPRRRARSNGDRGVAAGPAREARLELARALLAVGVRKGARVAVLLPNRPEWLVAAFAIGKLGAITVGVSTFSAPREIAWTIEHCRPAAIITLEAFRGRSYLEPLYATCPELATSAPGALRSERLPELRAVVCIDTRPHDGVYRLSDFVGRASQVRTEALHAAQARVTASA